MGEAIRLQSSGDNVMGSNTGGEEEIRRLRKCIELYRYKLSSIKRRCCGLERIKKPLAKKARESKKKIKEQNTELAEAYKKIEELSMLVVAKA